jgi:hypothetical protein
MTIIFSSRDAIHLLVFFSKIPLDSDNGIARFDIL